MLTQPIFRVMSPHVVTLFVLMVASSLGVMGGVMTVDGRSQRPLATSTSTVTSACAVPSGDATVDAPSCDDTNNIVPEVGLPVTQPVSPYSDVPPSIDADDRARLHALYDAPPAVVDQSMRTKRPQRKPQPPPRATVFNATNIHELPATPINLRYIPNFLSPAECRHFIELVQRIGLLQSPVLLEDGTAGPDDAKRTSSSCFLPPHFDPIVSDVERRVAELTNSHVEQVQSLQVVEYQPGQRFTPHFDGNEALPLRYTIFAYLNDVPPKSGGETDFPALGIRFQPVQGNAIFWENMCPQVSGSAAAHEQWCRSMRHVLTLSEFACRFVLLRRSAISDCSRPIKDYHRSTRASTDSTFGYDSIHRRRKPRKREHDRTQGTHWERWRACGHTVQLQGSIAIAGDFFLLLQLFFNVIQSHSCIRAFTSTELLISMHLACVIDQMI
jgi:hypothetical protein